MTILAVASALIPIAVVKILIGNWPAAPVGRSQISH